MIIIFPIWKIPSGTEDWIDKREEPFSFLSLLFFQSFKWNRVLNYRPIPPSLLSYKSQLSCPLSQGRTPPPHPPIYLPRARIVAPFFINNKTAQEKIAFSKIYRLSFSHVCYGLSWLWNLSHDATDSWNAFIMQWENLPYQ